MAQTVFFLCRFATGSFLVPRMPETMHKHQKAKSSFEMISSHKFGIWELPSALV
jgi:hypothetical protein